MIKDFAPEKFDLNIDVEWPDITDRPLPASRVTIRNHDDPEKKVITTISGMTIYCTAGAIVWAELEMYADLDGKPVLSGKPYLGHDMIITGVFRAEILQFQSAYSYRQGFKATEGAVHV